MLFVFSQILLCHNKKSKCKDTLLIICVFYMSVIDVFHCLQEIPYKFQVAVLIEYIRSLSQRDIPVQVLVLINLSLLR